MARLSTRLCAHGGCHEIGVDVAGGWYCEQHRKQHRAPRRTNTDHGYQRRSWRRARDQFARQHPTCQAIGCRQPVAIVHHIDGLGPLGPRGYDWDNLASLCHHHHRLITVHPERVTLAG